MANGYSWPTYGDMVQWPMYGGTGQQQAGQSLAAVSSPWATSPTGGWPMYGGQTQQQAAGTQAAAGTEPAQQMLPGWLPWGNWGQTPWAGIDDKKQAQQEMAWMNVALPWMQAAMQGQQWGTEFDWRKAMDEWQKGFQQEQFEYQQGQDLWGQGMQEKQLEAQQEQANLQTFGRRWKPQTRWM